MKGGKIVGLSMFSGYQLQRAVDALAAASSTRRRRSRRQVTLVWGEENGGTKKTTVERHKQTEIRATVGAVPYGDDGARHVSAEVDRWQQAGGGPRLPPLRTTRYFIAYGRLPVAARCE